MTNDMNLWINWALNAVLGRMREADVLMQQHTDAIRRGADALNERYAARGISAGALYRGILLEPGAPYPLPKFDDLTFLSWSEDRDVARWFASTESVISAYAVAQWPAARGHLLELDAPRSRVLYHWKWAQGLAGYALFHPDMGIDGMEQISWSVRTQREVITEPVAGLVPVPVDVVGDEAKNLDRRFAPPWATMAWATEDR